MELKYHEINGEKIIPVIFYGGNRDGGYLEWNKKVNEHLGVAMNYVEAPFPGISHGAAMNEFAHKTHNLCEYWLFMETDSVFLRRGCIEELYDKVKDKKSIVSGAQNSNHKKTINGDFNHPYAGPHALMLSTELWRKLGKPSFDHLSSRSDTAEEITYFCESLGFNITLIWPAHVEGLTSEECVLHGIPVEHTKSKVGCHWFGRGTTYSDIYYHAMCQTVPSSLDLFVKKCKEILNG